MASRESQLQVAEFGWPKGCPTQHIQILQAVDCNSPRTNIYVWHIRTSSYQWKCIGIRSVSIKHLFSKIFVHLEMLFILQSPWWWGDLLGSVQFRRGWANHQCEQDNATIYTILGIGSGFWRSWYVLPAWWYCKHDIRVHA